MENQAGLITLLFFVGCKPSAPNPPDRTMLQVTAEFEYKGRPCQVVEVYREAWSQGRYYPQNTFLRFIDCGDGLVNGQFPVHMKSGTQLR